MKPRVLLISRNLPPLVGGMERLNWHMADELSKYTDIKIIGPKGAAALKPKNLKLTEVPLKPLPLFLLVALIKGIWIALRWKPDVIFAGSGLTAPIVWITSKLCSARSVVYLHGFDITVKNKLYQLFWSPTFRNLDTVIVNSTPTKKFALTAGIAEKKIHIIHPGTTLPQAPRPKHVIYEFKKRHHLVNKKILLSVGRLTTRKGLKEFVTLALPAIVQAEPKTLLLIVGETPKNSLGASMQTQAEIMAAAKLNHIEEHIKFLGVITDRAELSTIYEAADLHIFPVRDIPDDPEGFGMVAIEAAAHGIPTVAFATGGVVDAIKEGQSGYLTRSGDYNELAKSTINIIQNTSLDWKLTAKSFALRFSWEEFGKKILHSIKNTEQYSQDGKNNASN